MENSLLLQVEKLRLPRETTSSKLGTRLPLQLSSGTLSLARPSCLLWESGEGCRGAGGTR